MNPNGGPETSASRLLSLLRKAKSVEQTQAAIAGWCQVYDIEMTSDLSATYAAYFRATADLLALNNLVQDETKNHIGTENVDLYMRNYGGIQTAMDRFPGISANTMAQHIDVIDDGAEHTLELIDDLLKRQGTVVPTIDPEAIKKLRVQVEEVILAVVEEDDLDDATKKTVIGLLRNVDSALRDSKINGVMGIAEGYDRAMGGFVRRPNLLVRLTESKTFTAITSLMGAVSLFITLATPAYNAIEGGGSNQDSKPAISNITVDETVNNFYQAIETSRGTYKITELPELEAPIASNPEPPADADPHAAIVSESSVGSEVDG